MAVRFDVGTGTEQRLVHVPSSSGLLYTWAALPAGATRCVVICSSVLSEFAANYHRERLLGLALAESGWGVVRFHYAGEGNSLGPKEHLTLESMAEDARAILAYASDLGFHRFGLVGTRLGTLVAARTARSLGRVPLALWEPATDPLRFIKEGQRAQQMSRVAGGDRQDGPTDWRRQLERDGVCDLFGYSLYPPLVESLARADILTELGSEPRPVLVAQFRNRDRSIEGFADALAQRGFEVTSHAFGVPEAWWLPSEDVITSESLTTTTAEWLSSHVPGTEE